MQSGNNKLIGGTSLHVSDLIQGLKNNYNFHILVPYNGIFRLCSYWDTGYEIIDISINILQCYTTGFFNSNYSKMLKDIIDILKIDIIHIHHMIGHYFDIINIIKKKNIKLFITLHDYFSVCPRINKINHDNKYCGYPNEDECSICLSSYVNDYIFLDGIKNIIIWRNIWNLLFSYADKIIVPSEAAKKEILEGHKNLTIDVIEHGIYIYDIKRELNIDTDNEFHVAFIGDISPHKGKKTVEDLIKFSHQFNDNIYFNLFGYIESDILQYKNIIYHGIYDRRDLNYLFKKNNIKLICIFSIWPETFCYTLSESLSNSIPILTFSYGAVGQKVCENNLGWLIKNCSSISEIYKTIKNIYNDKEGYREISKYVSKYYIKNIEEMCNDYDNIYSSYKTNRLINNPIRGLIIYFKMNFIYNINSLYKEKQNSWFQRKIIGLIKCYLENGLKYTIKLLIKKLLKKLLENHYNRS
jgi:hypothetical protein